MKHTIGRCPYCDGYEISVDTGPTKPEFVSDYHCWDPLCEHLVFASVRRQVEVVGPEGVRVDFGRSARWFFDIAEGLRELPLDAPREPLMDYVDHWISGLMPLSDEPRDVEYAMEGGTDLTGGRDGVAGPDGVWVSDTLDGFAVFAPNPDTLAAVVEELAGVDPFEDTDPESGPS